VIRDAHVSGEYRYWLSRIWDEKARLIFWVMLNPSTADATQDDATIRKCIGFSQRWVFGGLYVFNLFALRSTDPKALYSHADPVGPLNRKIFADALERLRPSKIVAAWGNHGTYKGRGAELMDEFEMEHLGLTKIGQPRHPLYVPYTQKLILGYAPHAAKGRDGG
jgi:hypothetical protein